MFQGTDALIFCDIKQIGSIWDTWGKISAQVTTFRLIREENGNLFLL